MADVFIAYSSEDHERVRFLAEALERRGFSVWWDRALAVGQEPGIALRELDAAQVVLVVWTAGAISSSVVRDEAGRARDDGRLLAVKLDRVEPPLGFGDFHVEDFSRWNGALNAPPFKLLAETVEAKLAGRDADMARTAHRRRRLMKPVRGAALFVVVLVLAAIAVGAPNLLSQHRAPASAPASGQSVDLRAALLPRLQDGKLTPDESVQLANLLQGGSAGASNDAFSQAVSASYAGSVAQLLRYPDAQVRLDALQMGDPAKRGLAIEALWAYAAAHPESRQSIYQACAAVAAANNDPLAPQALAYATEIAPQNADNWRLVAHVYRGMQRSAEADAAQYVADGVAAQAQGDNSGAEQKLQQALPGLDDASARAFVAAQLGALAAARNDFTSASARYAAAYRAAEQVAQGAPDSPTAQRLQDVTQSLVDALDRSGRSREACQQMQQAEIDHDVGASNAAFIDRCAKRFHVQLRPAQP
ncbi:MAG: toll/interleukin-1 receptor domain-containing protein [Alphaproteobacteria bacterium]